MTDQLHAVVATVEMGFLAGIPPHMVEDMAPSLKAIDNAVMEHPKVRRATIELLRYTSFWRATIEALRCASFRRATIE